MLASLKLECVPRRRSMTETTQYEDVRALKQVNLQSGWDPSVVQGIEAAAWLAQAMVQDPDGSILAASLEEARMKAKRNFNVETYTRLHEEWEREYAEYDQYAEAQQRAARIRVERNFDVDRYTQYGAWMRGGDQDDERDYQEVMARCD